MQKILFVCSVRRLFVIFFRSKSKWDRMSEIDFFCQNHWFYLKNLWIFQKNSIAKWQNPPILWKMCFLRVKWHPSYFSLKSKKVCNKSCCIWFSVVKISILSPFFAIYIKKKLLKNTFLLNKSIENDKMILSLKGNWTLVTQMEGQRQNHWATWHLPSLRPFLSIQF